MQNDNDQNHQEQEPMTHYYYVGTNNISVPMTYVSIGTTYKMTVIRITQEPVTYHH